MATKKAPSKPPLKPPKFISGCFESHNFTPVSMTSANYTTHIVCTNCGQLRKLG
jgi:hypothetical protein